MKYPVTEDFDYLTTWTGNHVKESFYFRLFKCIIMHHMLSTMRTYFRYADTEAVKSMIRK